MIYMKHILFFCVFGLFSAGLTAQNMSDINLEVPAFRTRHLRWITV